MRDSFLAFLLVGVVLLAAVLAFLLLAPGQAPPPEDPLPPGSAPPAEGPAPPKGVSPSQDPTPLVFSLPSPRTGAATAWADGTAYLFGGHGPAGLLDEVVAYDARAGNARVVARLPQPLFTAGAVWTGEAAYVFGGSADGGGTGLVDVLRFDPATAHVVKVAVLPQPTMAAGVAWDPRPTAACPEGCAYVLGGSASMGTYSRDVVRFDPSSHVVTPMGPVLPARHRLGAVAWTGDAAYVLGGYDGDSLDLIVRYEPLANRATTASARLPNATHGAVAFAHGGLLHLLGGSNELEDLDQAVVYDPARDRIEEKNPRLPCPAAYAAAALDGDHALLLGGRRGGVERAVWMDVVQSYDLAQGAVAASEPC